MPYRNVVRGSLVLLGVALGLIFTAGAASAQAEPSDAPAIGDALLIERPAPRPNPANELREQPALVDVPASEAAPVAPAASVSDRTPVAAPVPASGAAAPARSARTAARATEVKGVVVERSADGALLARTGVDTVDLVALAGVLLALGWVLVRLGMAPDTAVDPRA
jgi:hypothetical protein